jgi:segregation and condensation protein A
MQYRAFKQMAAVLQDRFERQQRRYPRAVGLDGRYAALLPEVLITLTPQGLADLAARALAPRPEPVLSLAHVHAPAVSVREQAAVIVDRLRRVNSTTFRALSGDAADTLTTVARFLALLELFREGVIAFEQASPLGELHVRWTGGETEDVEVSDEFDSPESDATELDDKSLGTTELDNPALDNPTAGDTMAGDTALDNPTAGDTALDAGGAGDV